MKIVIIGSGNVATHLTGALAKSGQEICQVWSNRLANAQILADTVNAQAIASLDQVDLNADLCFVAIKDDAVPDIAKQLLGFKGIIVHTSGAVAMSIFEGFERYGVFYPLQTFSKSKKLDFSTIPLCLEANTIETMDVLKTVAEKLSSHVVEVSSDQRKILHLAAVFACNFTNHLYALSAEILAEHALEFDLIRPLINETALKVQKALPLDVQTGPAIRNDIATEQKHLQLLDEQPQLKTIYKTLSESIKKNR